jgi:hypothetical protein
MTTHIGERVCVSRNLITDGGKDEGSGYEELCSA